MKKKRVEEMAEAGMEGEPHALEYGRPGSALPEPDTRTRWPVTYIAVLAMVAAVAFVRWLDPTPPWDEVAAICIVGLGVIMIVAFAVMRRRRR